MIKPKFLSWVAIGLIFLLFLSFSSIVSFVTDLWWFDEVGYRELFIKPLLIKVILFFSAAVISGVFLLANLLIASRSKVSWVAIIPRELLGNVVTLEDKVVKKIGAAVIVALSLLFGLLAASYWQEILKFVFASEFKESDPIFNKEVGYYIFKLPSLLLSQSILQILAVLAFIESLIIYLLRGSLSFSNLLNRSEMLKGKLRGNRIEKNARIHLGFLLFLLLVLMSYGKYLSLFELPIAASSLIFGAAYTDIAVAIPLIRISIAITIFIAVLSLIWGLTGRLKPLIGAVVLYLITGFIFAAVPQIFQKLIVAPNELKMETPFLKHNIQATRKAYDLDKIEEREITADKSLTSQDLENNSLTIKNVRLWDRDPLLSTFSQIQEIRTYYEFVSVDNDRYMIDGEIRQMMLSLRELASESLPNKSWINEKLTFTHGYGLAAGPVNQVTNEGLPVLFVKDLPPVAEKKELTISQPQIYYGELPNDYVVVKTRSKEFDYPKGEENVYSTYQGKGGVVIDSPIKKLLYAIRFNSLKLFLSGDIANDSRILYFRNIKERVSRIAPFLIYDSDPYAVVADGKIYWILDAYTKTDYYPYSQPLSLDGESVNYIRNSVKVVVNAYDGSVIFYQADANDPIIRTYTKIFPNTFKPLSQLSQALASHIRYPEDIFSLQTAVYTTYHMDDTQIFYNKEDQWEIPAIQDRKEQAEPNSENVIGPRHMIMKLPGEKKEEFILMLPFTPRNKDNLSAWMVARNDGDSYGKLVVYRFPKQKLVYGPKQVISRISQDAEISRQISLWDQRGSQVIQGPLLVIPIEESLIYVRPLYLKAETGKIPELKRVIVAYENKIAMEATLEQALAKILGVSQPKSQESVSVDQPQIAPNQTTPETLREANELYERALEAQKQGDWAGYGDAIRKLGEVLRR